MRAFYSRQVNHRNFSYIQHGGRPYLTPESSKRGKRLCVVRTPKESDTRVFLQRDCFEKKAAEHGFELIRPEQYTHEEQIRMFSAASVLVGEYGSGMHNSVFLPPGA